MMYRAKPVKIQHILLWISLISFPLNFIWENLHAGLYTDFNAVMGNIYFLACSLGDVLLIFIIYGLVALILGDRLWILYLNHRRFAAALLMSVLVSFAAEWLAVKWNFWTYNEKMPVTPFLEVGLSPFLAIVLIPMLTLVITHRMVVRD